MLHIGADYKGWVGGVNEYSYGGIRLRDHVDATELDIDSERAGSIHACIWQGYHLLQAHIRPVLRVRLEHFGSLKKR